MTKTTGYTAIKMVVSLLVGGLLLTGCGSASSKVTTSPSTAGTATSTPTASTTDKAPPQSAPVETTKAPVIPPGDPQDLSIPSINYQGDLIPLGVNDDDSLEVPSDYDQAGWYTQGTRPGEPGPTIIAAHVDSRSGPGAFYNLRDVQEGDQVEVTIEDGTAHTYEVYKVEDYPKKALPTVDVFGAVIDDELRLITCGGEFDQSLRSYTDNLVVYARHT